jgi:hypothetical protein
MAGAGLLMSFAQAGVGVFGALSGGAAEERKLEAEARMARMNADEADTVYRQDMMRQLSNIKAIRASSGMGIDTPSFGAVVEGERETASANRQRQVRGYNLKASQLDADASEVKRLAWLRAMGAGMSAFA